MSTTSRRKPAPSGAEEKGKRQTPWLYAAAGGLLLTVGLAALMAYAPPKGDAQALRWLLMAFFALVAAGTVHALLKGSRSTLEYKQLGLHFTAGGPAATFLVTAWLGYAMTEPKETRVYVQVATTAGQPINGADVRLMLGTASFRSSTNDNGDASFPVTSDRLGKAGRVFVTAKTYQDRSVEFDALASVTKVTLEKKDSAIDVTALKPIMFMARGDITFEVRRLTAPRGNVDVDGSTVVLEERGIGDGERVIYQVTANGKGQFSYELLVDGEPIKTASEVLTEGEPYIVTLALQGKAT